MLLSSSGADPRSTADLPAVPSARGRRWLNFEFVVLVEYWLAPLVLGITNYAGIWSDVGNLLFVGFVASLVAFVVLPLRRHLARVLASRRERFLFHAFWSAAFVLGLFVTNTFQWSSRVPGSPALLLGTTTVYTPFGAWPSLTVYLPDVGFFATLNVEILIVLGLISVLASSALRLRAARVSVQCDRPAQGRTSTLRRASVLAALSPLGFITGCSACAPLYLSAIGMVAPSAATGGLAFVPLVPWIGLAGLLYLGSFVLALRQIRRATSPPDERTQNAGEAE